MGSLTEGFLCARPCARHFLCINLLSPPFDHHPREVGTITVSLLYFLDFIFSYFHFTDEDGKAFTDVVNWPKEVKPDGRDSRASMFHY